MTEAKKAIEQMRETIMIISSNEFCVFGCKVMKQEGCRSYEERSHIDKNGICSKCKKKRYGFLTEEEKIIKEIIE